MSSNINPNNIDGTYPVAGQDNNSQGFRDNFTNIKTNFQYAEDEINDLQSKVVLKAALVGQTLDNDMLGSILSNAQMQDFSATRVALGTLSGSVGINYAAGHYQTVTTSGSISLAFTNWPAAGTQGWVIVRVSIANTAHTVTLPSAVGNGSSAKSIVGIEGISGQVITFAQTGTYELEFHTDDGGSTVYLSELTRPRNYFTNGITIASGNITAVDGTFSGDLTVTGNLYATGNVAADHIYNGTSSVDIQTASGNANVTIGGVANVAVFTTTGFNVTGLISASGNITGGNLITAGLGSFGTTVTATGNITGGNLITGGLASVTGNITGGNLITGGLASVTGNITGGNLITAGLASVTGNITGGNLITAGTVKSSSASAGIGYATGAGSTVTQGTSRTTGVTINAVSGAITLFSDAGTSSYTTFTVTNSAVAATDVIIVNQKSGTDKYEAFISAVAAGSFAITFSDVSGTTTEQPVFNFAVIKGVTA